MGEPLRVLIVDDEAPARLRLRQLLDDIAAELPTVVVAEAANGAEALERLQQGDADVALVDIRMPRMDGLQLALHLAKLPAPPAVIFVTAYDQYAVKAFELAATDYLLKPVRAERLGDALRKVRRPGARKAVEQALQALAPEGRSHLRSCERGRVLLIPIENVLYLRAELKYVTVRTADGEHLLEEPLQQLEAEFGERFLRVHRNCLVARSALAGYARENGGKGSGAAGESEARSEAPNEVRNEVHNEARSEAPSEPHWVLLLHGIDETIPVSRRQWPQVKSLFKS